MDGTSHRANDVTRSVSVLYMLLVAPH